VVAGFVRRGGDGRREEKPRRDRTGHLLLMVATEPEALEPLSVESEIHEEVLLIRQEEVFAPVVAGGY